MKKLKEREADEKLLEERGWTERKGKKRCEDFFEAEFGLQHLFVAYPPRIFSIRKPHVLPTTYPKSGRGIKI